LPTLLFGAAGSGKSETVKTVAGGLLDLGWDGLVVDLKEIGYPGSLGDWCAQYAGHHNVSYQALWLSDPNCGFWFNPLAGMGPDEMRNILLSLTDT
jgi:hypothetical protein